MRVQTRQSTFWDVEDASNLIRVHFIEKQEHHFVSPTFERFDIVSDHAVLLDYANPWEAIYLGSVGHNSQNVIERIVAEIASTTGPWRSADVYFNSQFKLLQLLQGGYGLLAKGPQPIIAIVHEVLAEAEIVHTILPDRAARWPMQAFIAGLNFVVAKDFRIEHRDLLAT